MNSENSKGLQQLKLVVKFLSDKYDDIFKIHEIPGTSDTLKEIPSCSKHTGLVVDLEDDEGVIDTIPVDKETVERYFNVEVYSEDVLYEKSQQAWINMLRNKGFNPNEELDKINQQIQ